MFGNVRFPEGAIFEDLIVAPLIYPKAQKIVPVAEPLYYYNVANGHSLTSLKNGSLKRDFRHLEAWIRFLENLDGSHDGVRAAYCNLVFVSAFVMLYQQIRDPQLTEKECPYLFSCIRKNRKHPAANVKEAVIHAFPAFQRAAVNNKALTVRQRWFLFIFGNKNRRSLDKWGRQFMLFPYKNVRPVFDMCCKYRLKKRERRKVSGAS